MAEPECLELTLDAASFGPAIIDELKSVFANFPGDAEVQLVMSTRGGVRKLRFGRDYRVAPSAGLRAELDELLGSPSPPDPVTRAAIPSSTQSEPMSSSNLETMSSHDPDHHRPLLLASTWRAGLRTQLCRSAAQPSVRTSATGAVSGKSVPIAVNVYGGHPARLRALAVFGVVLDERRRRP